MATTLQEGLSHANKPRRGDIACVRIGLTPEEVQRMQEQLSLILEQFDVLAGLDTSDVPPTGHAVHLENVQREDEVRASLSRSQVLANAPRAEDETFRVPMVLGES
jgi:aspartyl-tRNA(Asn)/glutamyl-tRNA(Gln) amidotransferase subunit C